MSVDGSYVRYVIKDNSQDIISLSEIFGISANVILEANKDIISDPTNIEEGTILSIPKDIEELEQLQLDYENSISDEAKKLKKMGVENYNGHRITWYSERVLPGGGLDIPGRHTDSNGIVRDENGYICVASEDYSKGSIVLTNLGYAKVYDSGCGSGTIDIYTNW